MGRSSKFRLFKASKVMLAVSSNEGQRKTDYHFLIFEQNSRLKDRL